MTKSESICNVKPTLDRVIRSTVDKMTFEETFECQKKTQYSKIMREVH